jgi:hypothetical protein
MDHLDILKEATRTISSPRRFVKNKFVTDRGGCSIGHLVVASQGGVGRLLGAAHSCAQLAQDTNNPELMLAIDYVAKAMHIIANHNRRLGQGEFALIDNRAKMVMMFNDVIATTHGLVVEAFELAVTNAEADLLPKEKPVPSFDMAEVEAVLAEYAEYEEQLAAA